MMKRYVVCGLLVLCFGFGCSGCAIPNAIGRTAAGVVKTTGKAVQAVGKGVAGAVK